MARYPLDWEVVASPAAKGAKEVAVGWKQLIELVRKDLSHGKERGAFPGNRRGRALLEGSELAVTAFTMQFVTHARFTTRPVVSVDPVGERLTAIPRGSPC